MLGDAEEPRRDLSKDSTLSQDNLQTPVRDQAQQVDTDEFWSVATPFEEPLSSRWFIPSIVALVAIATPWYLPEDVASRFWQGLPVWVWITLASSFGLSVLICYSALFLWRDRAPDSESTGSESTGSVPIGRDVQGGDAADSYEEASVSDSAAGPR